MAGKPAWRTAAVVVFAIIIGLVVRNQIKVALNRAAGRERAAAERPQRQALFDALRPVKLSKCRLERFGEKDDGGYPLCANLLDDVKAGYSYGISGYDQWGCDVSSRLQVTLHQYDCFNTTVPVCPRGRTIFHPDCVGGEFRTEEGRTFDSIAAQLNKNGDGSNRVVMKMDVEGAEWESFLAASDSVLERIDQLAIEFHGSGEARHLAVVRKLKRFFHVAHVHFNNYSCKADLGPFPSWAYEVLFINKRLDEIDTSGAKREDPGVDAPNTNLLPDCQLTTARQ